MSSLSIVVCTKDRAEQLVTMCQRLLSQSRLPDELVVVDQSDSDVSSQKIERESSRYPMRIKYIQNARIRGLAHARNVGLAHSSGDFVAFIDDDIELAPEALALLERALKDRARLVAVSGIVTNYVPPSIWVQLFTKLFFVGCFADERQPIYWRWQGVARGQLIATTKLCGGCMMWRRDALVSIGCFDLQYKGSSVGEDIEISQRALHQRSPGCLAFVGGVWVVNHVKGRWRLRAHREETQLVSAHYLYSRNQRKTIGTRAAYLLLAMGLWLSACASALRRCRWQPLASFWKGIRCIRNGYQGCAFLEPLSCVPMDGPEPCANMVETNVPSPDQKGRGCA